MRRIGFIVLAGLAAALAALLVQSALRRKDTELAKARVMATEILVAARDLPVGTKLQPDDVKLARWPRDSVPSGAIMDAHTVVDSIVKGEMVQDEPITSARLYTGDTAGVLSLLIPPDMRAMSVAVDEVSDIAGFVLPHARVDVLVALKEEGGPNGNAAHSKVVLENVEVLAVAQTTDHKDKPQVERVVTLLVTPEEAERLALASHEGSLRLALRNLNDEKIVNTSGSSVSTLLQVYGGAPPPPAIERPQFSQVRVPTFHRPLARVAATRIEVMRDGATRDALSFGADGKAIRPAASSQGPPPSEDQSQAQAQPAPVNAPAGRAVAMAAGPARAAAPSAPAAGEAQDDPSMAFQGPDAKTIDVH